MKIKDRLEYQSKPKPLTTKRDMKVSYVVADMVKMNFGSVIVTDQTDKVIGILTERDIMKRVVNENRDPHTTTVEEIMTENPRVANEDDEIHDWLRIMSNERFRRVPIVDEDNKPISIMTQGDFVSYTWPDLINQAGQMTKRSISSNYQMLIILAGITVYSLSLTYLLV